MTSKTIEIVTRVRNEWSIKGLFKKDYTSTQVNDERCSLNDINEKGGN